MELPAAETAYLTEVVARLRAVLGEALIAVYPTGSLALDGYLPGRSDIDLMAVTRPTPAEPVLRTLAARLSHDELPCPATGLEFVLYPSSTVAAGTVRAGYALDLNTGRELPPKVSLDPDSGPRFWYAIDRSVTYQADVALFGPPPRDGIMRPVPFDRLLPVVAESMRGHRTELLDNAVLNGCRALRYRVERRWYAKPVAARWALGAAPEYTTLIHAALASYAAGRDGSDPLPADDVHAFLGHVLDRLAP
jgi:Domain of unknown function (DUF4111)